MRPAFRMTEFEPPRSWKWVSSLLWWTVVYDHRFEALDGERTRLVWVVEAKGLGASILGPLFARAYRGSLDKAIPLLIAEMEGSGSAASTPDP